MKLTSCTNCTFVQDVILYNAKKSSEDTCVGLNW